MCIDPTTIATQVCGQRFCMSERQATTAVTCILNDLAALKEYLDTVNENLIYQCNNRVMIESFTERLGNPVTAGAGNAKELRETKPFPIDKSLIDAALTWETALEIAEEYEASKQQENKKLSQPCIDDFTDLINTYLTTGELVPGRFY
jgi:transcriptional regulator with GAF, ATPase, and Fis domain